MRHRLVVPRRTTDFTPGQASELNRAPITRARLLMAANLVRALGNAIASQPYELYPSGVRVKAPASPRILEPDVAIARSPVQFERDVDELLLNPIVVFGVLSDRSETLYRGELFRHYTTIPSLREIVLLSGSEAVIERFERQEEGVWSVMTFGAGATVGIREIACDLPVDEVYRGLSPAL